MGIFTTNRSNRLRYFLGVDLECDMKPSPTVTAKRSNRLRHSLGRDLECDVTLSIPQQKQVKLV
jgi:hypothetical protein